MQLVAHQFFDSKENVLSDGADELSVRRVVDEELQRKKLEIRMSVRHYGTNSHVKIINARQIFKINL